ncbi:hypothetical protein XENTR_v10007440 [Xenopus tropicalis]|uniref:Interleukin-18-binding protein isoform X2 n=1 Tax=Xenopus tropicalis TaxID=8364 RepID=A0A8J1J8D5_XENTR|nr:interleukin-18-binding protein isoform X2 [Xenopus tropicalis]KAE8628292.1 hypothetical protein XENTR_v10007440 [Xenopus tropicalis]
MPSRLSQPGQGILGTFSLFYLLLTQCCSVSHGKAVIRRPKIISPKDNAAIAAQGSGCTITCVARSSWPDFHIVYWLADNNFIEDKFPDGRVWEEPERQSAGQTTEKSLVFSSVEEKDFSVRFCCVVQDPSGADIRNISLQRGPQVLTSPPGREIPPGDPPALIQ